VLFKESLKEAKVFDDKEFEKVEQEAVDAVARAVKFADESPFPDESELMTNIYA
jgi:pyruvate dehydrogenase E1 component alpha subunit